MSSKTKFATQIRSKYRIWKNDLEYQEDLKQQCGMFKLSAIMKLRQKKMKNAKTDTAAISETKMALNNEWII